MPRTFALQRFNKPYVKKSAAILIAAVLLSPSVLTALTSTEINFELSLVAILLGVLSVRRYRGARYVICICVALLLTFPPFPLWLHSDGVGGMRIYWSQEVIDRAPGFRTFLFLWNIVGSVCLFKLLNETVALPSTSPKG